jgi:transposase
MSGAVAGIDPHQDTFTVGMVDHHGVEATTATFPNRATGYLEAIELLATHTVEQVGVEGTASWGQHVAIALVAAGLDVREVPAQRSAAAAWSRPGP